MKTLLALLGASLATAFAAEPNSGKIPSERAAEFAFERNPEVVRNGDHYAISFSTTAYCDVTLAIEHAGGRIVRHLASGVLGPNAPEPFKPGTKAQTVVWDGKDDQGRYLGATPVHLTLAYLSDTPPLRAPRSRPK